jgi:ribonuclease P/MRP protein subunit RPP1
VVLQFELLYSAGLFPPPSVSADTARRYRQNWMSNAREVVRVTGGKGVILSSGPGGSAEGMRGALDVVNL